MIVRDYQLDSDTVVGLLRNRPASIRERVEEVITAGASLSISAVVLFGLS